MATASTKTTGNGTGHVSRVADAAALVSDTAKQQDGTEAAAIQISRIGTERLLVPITGISPLIMHNFGAKQRQKMLAGMQGVKTPKTNKDPQAEYEAAFHLLSDGTGGFPAAGFKLATVGAARFYGGDVTMTALRQSMFFFGEWSDKDPQQLVRIDGEVTMREDVVRVARGGTDLRYRPMYQQWKATLNIVYVKSMLTRDSLISLVDAGGMGVGVGEWRPERGGDFGQYQIDASKNVEIVNG